MHLKGRAIILMMDSFGIGGAEDAAAFKDEGANTFLHIAQNYKDLKVPNLAKLGLVKAGEASCGVKAPIDQKAQADFDLPSKYGFMRTVHFFSHFGWQGYLFRPLGNGRRSRQV